MARGLGVGPDTVVTWIRKGLMRATLSTRGRYMIKHRAIRRALRDHPQVAAVVMRAWDRYETQQRRIRSGAVDLSEARDEEPDEQPEAGVMETAR